MNLKEAFRCQNVLDGILNQAIQYLYNPKYTMHTVITHNIKAVNPDPNAEDKIEDSNENRDVEWTADEMVGFVIKLLSIKSDLTNQIAATKKAMSIDLDATLSLNNVRRRVLTTMDYMAERKPSESISKATGYRFNNEGNQVSFIYDVKTVTTIDFDRNRVKGIRNDLNRVCDELSDTVDKLMLDTTVNFELPFGVTDKFDDVIEWYLSTLHK